MGKISAALAGRLASTPHQPMDLIVRTEGDPALLAARLEEMGFSVRHQFRLLPGLAVTGPAGRVPTLLDQDWIVTIEEDRPVAASSEEADR